MNYFIEGTLAITENPDVIPAVMHSHDVYEIYLFLDGKTDYLVEGNKYRLRKGDVMLMRRGELHINSIRSNAAYKRMYVNFDITELLKETDTLSLLDMFDRRPLGTYNHYSAKDFPDNHWQSCMHAICKAKTRGEKLCYLLPLLQELSKEFTLLSKIATAGAENPVAKICQYINDDLSRDLSLEHLSEVFYLSKAHLNRLFKTNVGTTVGQYIRLKRLFLAREAIQKGEQPMDVYAKCGFHDYTTFYRAFKQQFSISPKEASCQSVYSKISFK